MNPRPRCLAVFIAALLSLLCMMPVHAGTNTLAIFANTIKAYPSCLNFQIEGLCFFLRCSLKGCAILTSVRVSHYVPDVIVSTYNEPVTHPWDDIGKPVAIAASGLGSWMLGTLTDSSAGYHNDSERFAVFKGADAYGNPAGMLSQLLTGDLSGLVRFDVPGTRNLTQFPTKELPSIAARWASVPRQMLETVMGQAYDIVKAPLELVNKINQIPSLLANGQNIMGLANGLTPAKILSFVGIDIGPLLDAYEAISALTGGGALVNLGPELFCPGSASLLTLHFQSELDSHFWRGVLPVESLYPGSWLPLTSIQVGSWGGVFPRTGELVQQDPVRASGVIAERVMSIIQTQYQPHVYTELELNNSGYKYFNQDDVRAFYKWQRLYPDAQTSCHQFGDTHKNYDISERSTEDGYVWTAWTYYSCCQRRGTFLYSIGN